MQDASPGLLQDLDINQYRKNITLLPDLWIPKETPLLVFVGTRPDSLPHIATTKTCAQSFPDLSSRQVHAESDGLGFTFKSLRRRIQASAADVFGQLSVFANKCLRLQSCTLCKAGVTTVARPSPPSALQSLFSSLHSAGLGRVAGLVKGSTDTETAGTSLTKTWPKTTSIKLC